MLSFMMKKLYKWACPSVGPWVILLPKMMIETISITSGYGHETVIIQLHARLKVQEGCLSDLVQLS